MRRHPIIFDPNGDRASMTADRLERYGWTSAGSVGDAWQAPPDALDREDHSWDQVLRAKWRKCLKS
jgi:hypothetical protein